MNRSALRTLLPTLLAGHVPARTRHYSYSVHDALPNESRLGFYVDPHPFQGKIIAKTDEMMVVKTARTQFAVLDRTLVNDDPPEGSTIEVTPYARRDFDGSRMDKPVEKVERLPDGTTFTSRTVILGGNTTRLPVPKPQSPELADLIEQIETMPAPDGRRRIVHILVDALATDFRVDDPPPAQIIATPPTIHFRVSTRKFIGCVALSYDRALDYYRLLLHRDGEVISFVEHIDFTSLGQVLHDQLDDLRWQTIDVRVLSLPKPKPKPRSLSGTAVGSSMTH